MQDNTWTILEAMSTDVDYAKNWRKRHKEVRDRLYKKPVLPKCWRTAGIVVGGMWQGISPGYAQQITERLSAKHIIAAVAEFHKITVADLRGPHRSRYLILPRAQAAFLLREWKPGLSFQSIGVVLDRDHSTVIHLIRTIWPRHRAELEPFNNQIRELAMRTPR